jgi:dihydrofolate reductase
MVETKRLILKPLTYKQLVKYSKNDNSLEEELNLNKTSRTISSELKEALEKTILPNVADETKNYLYSTLWTAISKADNKMIGDLCIMGEPNPRGEIEIGYGTYNEFQRKGYMSEIVGGIIEWTKTQTWVKSITASTDKTNLASFKVLQNNGFVKISENETTFTWKLQLCQRKLILYIATSLDGYIAMPNDDLGFLSMVDQEDQDYGYEEFVKTVDTVILGRKTYDKVISMGIDFPYGDKEVYIITRTPKQDVGSIKYYSGDLKALVSRLKSKEGKNIFCDGGSDIVNELLKEDLIDEFIISIIPIIVGNGTKLFKDGRPIQKLALISVKSFDKGLAQLHYHRIKNQ